MKLLLLEPFASAWEKSDPFEAAFTIQGENYRDMGDRKTSRFEFAGNAYFVKTHAGVGVREILKNLLYFRIPVLGAENEYRAILRIKELSVDTMTAAAFGRRGWNPAAERSFLITEALEPTIPLDEYCNPGLLSEMGVSARRALVRKLAEISRTLHENGVNHRDYYLCHFLLDTSDQCADRPLHSRPLYLIDLHRVQLRRKTPQRWKLKDMAGLVYSARQVGFDRRDFFRLIASYRQRPLKQVLRQEKAFWGKVVKVADKLHAKGLRKGYHE